MPNIVAVSVRNWAHIIRTPPAMSWSLLMTSDVKASPTAARNELTATNFSLFLSCMIVIILIAYQGKHQNRLHLGQNLGTKIGKPIWVHSLQSWVRLHQSWP